MYLEELTWLNAEKFFAKEPVAVLPVGSIRQHGPGCPLGADHVVPAELVKMLDADNRNDVLVLPPVPYGLAGSSAEMCGTIDVTYETLYQYISSIVNSLMKQGIKKFLFHNGSEENEALLERVSLELSQKGGMGVVMNWLNVISDMKSDWSGAHGGAKEIAAIMYLRPEWQVDKEFTAAPNAMIPGLRFVDSSTVVFQDAKIKWARPVTAVSPSGYFKGPDYELSRANDKWGKRMCETVTIFTGDLIAKMKKIEL